MRGVRSLTGESRLTFRCALVIMLIMKAHGIVGIIVLVISEILLFKGVEVVRDWFYVLAWWSYILIVDALVFRLKGQSLIVSRRGEFFRMLPLSVFIWLVFELFNLRLQNWHYVTITSSLLERWVGYFVSFATVLPGLFETAELIEFGIKRMDGHVSPPRPARRTLARWLQPSMVFGMVLCALTILLPKYFFPAVWLGFVFLLEPINYKLNGPSLLKDIEHNDFVKLYSLLASGLICGLLWEFWNFWAQAKWVYTIPFFGNWRIFEMPLLGFLGFPPFALECYAMYQGLLLLEKRMTPIPHRMAFVIFLIAFILFSFYAIDLQTVRSFS